MKATSLKLLNLKSIHLQKFWITSISGIVGAGKNVGAFMVTLVLKSKSAFAETAGIANNQNLNAVAVSTASSTAVSNGYLINWIFCDLHCLNLVNLKFFNAYKNLNP